MNDSRPGWGRRTLSRSSWPRAVCVLAATSSRRAERYSGDYGDSNDLSSGAGHDLSTLEGADCRRSLADDRVSAERLVSYRSNRGATAFMTEAAHDSRRRPSPSTWSTLAAPRWGRSTARPCVAPRRTSDGVCGRLLARGGSLHSRPCRAPASAAGCAEAAARRARRRRDGPVDSISCTRTSPASSKNWPSADRAGWFRI